MQIDCTDIIDIFKSHLRVDNSVKSIAHTFLNERYAQRIDYAPYFQRKYVWDSEKASYFIESILLGTEIPPIVLFDDNKKNEVIDGRQRYETIKRFLDNSLALDGKGLKSLMNLDGLHFSELPDELKDDFKNTKIRILQFSIVNEPALTPEQEDKVKKEIFTRYNSGIIALKPQEIERAAYINDPIVKEFKEYLEQNQDFLEDCQSVLLPRRKHNLNKRDKINYILSRARTVLSMRYIPIQSFAAANSKTDVIRNYFLIKVSATPREETLHVFILVINKLCEVRSYLIHQNPSIADNTLFFEVLFWGLSIVLDESAELFNNLDSSQIANDVAHCDLLPKLWENINVERNDFESVFFSTGSHYYKSIINRYTFISNYLSVATGIDFSNHMRNKVDFDRIMSQNPILEQYKNYKLSKTDPVSATIYDILSDVKTSNFLIRPDYQRSEVPNRIQKASYLMESILLGIRIPPIFIYRRSDRVSEVIDGQQRLLTILGFLRESYKTENGTECLSDKNGFKLTKLRFLEELNGKDIDGIDAIDPHYKDRILDFQIDIVEINQSQNPNFNPIDLFLRLNSKPFPIEENTFEMWNAFLPKNYAERIKGISNKYAGKIFRTLDPRMKNEELITMLAYLAYIKRKYKTEPGEHLNIYVRNNRVNARVKTKSQITAILTEVASTNDKEFEYALNDVEIFIDKIRILCGDDFSNFGSLLAHSSKSRLILTNQNFYLLWIALEHISVERISVEKDTILVNVKALFIESTDIHDENFDVGRFITRLSEI